MKSPEPLFPIEDLDGRPLDEILSQARDLIEDLSFPTVRRWREQGGKVVGHFQEYFPEELADAAGLLAFKVRGAPAETMHAESRFGSYLCSILKTSLELALSGAVALDLFVSHPICDAARNLAAVWGRNVAYPSEILYLPQNANSRHAPEYLRQEYGRMLRILESIGGRAVSDDDLRASMAVYNENRGLLRQLYAIKRDTPWLLPVDEAYILTCLAGMLPRREHNDLLRRLLPRLQERPARPQDKIRNPVPYRHSSRPS